MDGKFPIRRYIVCVDGVGRAGGGTDWQNPSNISRLRDSIKTGSFNDLPGRTIEQDVKYYQVSTAETSKLSGKSATWGEQQVREIVLDTCENLHNPNVEVFLFGSGCGAHIVRRVANMLHQVGIPEADQVKESRGIYNSIPNLAEAREPGQNLRNSAVNIQFVGLFDSLKFPTDGDVHDTRIVSTIRNFRHAIAFNETKAAHSLDLPETPSEKDLRGRSFVQAWFLGHHADIVGGVQHDGFSIHPLQWIMVEAMLAGLILSFSPANTESAARENPLTLAFPQHAGHAPNVGNCDITGIWQLRYANNLEVRMFDLQKIHISSQQTDEVSHSLHLKSANSLYNSTRKIFNKDKGDLIGYEGQRPCGTVIHPSVYCILDRNPHFLEQRCFRVHREKLTDFETNCLNSNSGDMPPWLQDAELLESGVKAFRILVCGKTGVGKSTLINKVFGVEMTEESNSYAQGQHDINQAFESPNHPGLLIHDSRGWQAGSNQELELIAQFLRHRAFQKDPAEALHVIWFCVDSDVSRIEEADKKTFETIAQFCNTVPVFIVGTKKDKLIAYRKMALLEDYMRKTNDYQESNRLADREANELADQQFGNLRAELAQIKSHKVDGYVCISQNDDSGIRSLLSQTLGVITNERVRLFCAAAQVVDVDKKIDSAIAECMRLGTHAIRTAMVPLPFSGIVSTPTVSRLICEHVLLCFGFPKAIPDEVEEVMNRIVLGNLKKYLALSLAQFVLVASASSGLALVTAGAGSLLWFVSPFLSAPPTARMLLKCSAEMILILERSFRYGGKYVSVKQIESAAKQYVSIDTTVAGKTKELQQYVREEIDRLVPLKKIAVGFRFNKLHLGLEQVIYKNRFDKPPDYETYDPFASKMAELDAALTGVVEAPADTEHRAELPGDSQGPVELDGGSRSYVAELPGSEPPFERENEVPQKSSKLDHATSEGGMTGDMAESLLESVSVTSSASMVQSSTGSSRSKSLHSSSRLLSRVSKSLRIQKSKTKE